jgi:hypothetical protein
MLADRMYRLQKLHKEAHTLTACRYTPPLEIRKRDERPGGIGKLGMRRDAHSKVFYGADPSLRVDLKGADHARCLVHKGDFKVGSLVVADDEVRRDGDRDCYCR